MNDGSSNPRVPWITREGFVDVARLPIDGILRQMMEGDETKFRSGAALLGMMCGTGRKEAGVFLMGLLVASGDNWERRRMIVESLHDFKTEACARLLFTELRRVKSSNTTRRYLDGVIEALAAMPAELAEEEMLALANDSFFSHKMRRKFRAAMARHTGCLEDWS